METILINELKTDAEVLEGYNVMKLLRPHLDEQSYLSLVKEARKIENYRQFVLRLEGRIVAIIGFQPMITLYYGRYIWVCDLVTDSTVRSRGFGEKLLTFVQAMMKEEGYESIALSSGLQRDKAHRFYEQKLGYERASYVFKKSLTDDK